LWLTLLVVGVTLAVDWAGSTVRPGWAVTVALVIVAGGLLVGAGRGRARILVPVGLLLAPLWVAFALSDIPRYEGEGRVVHAPERLADLSDDYTHGYGHMVVDLTAVTLPDGEARQIDLGLTSGEIEVRVPSDVTVEVSAEAGLGATTEQWVWTGRHGRSETLDESGQGLLAGHRASFGMPARPSTCSGDYWERSFDPQWGEPIEDHWPELEARWDPGTERSDLVEDTNPDGDPCTPRPAPADPARLELDVRVGLGHLEVRHVETPA
jgi:hypothetical protein